MLEGKHCRKICLRTVSWRLSPPGSCFLFYRPVLLMLAVGRHRTGAMMRSWTTFVASGDRAPTTYNSRDASLIIRLEANWASMWWNHNEGSCAQNGGTLNVIAAWYNILTDALFAVGLSSKVSIICQSLARIFQFYFTD